MPDALAVHKALGDDTRFAIFSELERSTSPCSAGELSERLGLHPNTLRPHLERMREAGLVEVEAVHRGTVGRPQLRYSLAPGAPGLGLEPPAHTFLAGLMAALAESAGADGGDAAALGRRVGEEYVARRQPVAGCLSALRHELDRLGFDPVSSATGDGARGEVPQVRVDFLHCPFRELAEAYPELVCQLHRGIVEGILDDPGMVVEFGTLIDRDPCHVVVEPGYPEETSPAHRPGTERRQEVSS